MVVPPVLPNASRTAAHTTIICHRHPHNAERTGSEALRIPKPAKAPTTPFVAISGTKGFPPKLIKVDLGNVPTQAVASALRVQYPEILAFRYDDEPIYHLE